MDEQKSAKVIQFPLKNENPPAAQDKRLVAFASLAVVFFILAGVNFFYLHDTSMDQSRTLASISKKLVPQWKNRLQAKGLRAVAVGSKPNSMDLLGYEDLGGRYSLSVSNGYVAGGVASDERGPVAIKEPKSFLQKHAKAFMGQNLQSIEQVGQDVAESGYIHTYRMQGSSSSVLVELKFDDQDHLLSFQVKK